MEYNITHYPKIERFQTLVDGYTAYLQYEIENNKMCFISTFVPSAIESRGVAAALVKEGLAFAKMEGLTPVPKCSYVVAYMKRYSL